MLEVQSQGGMGLNTWEAQSYLGRGSHQILFQRWYMRQSANIRSGYRRLLQTKGRSSNALTNANLWQLCLPWSPLGKIELKVTFYGPSILRQRRARSEKGIRQTDSSQLYLESSGGLPLNGIFACGSSECRPKAIWQIPFLQVKYIFFAVGTFVKPLR